MHNERYLSQNILSNGQEYLNSLESEISYERIQINENDIVIYFNLYPLEIFSVNINSRMRENGKKCGSM